MRADTELFKDKIEVRLDGRQVFYLFFGGAVIASLVFVLGVMVGKRVEARAHTDERPATGAARDPLAALDQLSRRDEVTLTSAAGASAPAVERGPAAIVTERDEAEVAEAAPAAQPAARSAARPGPEVSRPAARPEPARADRKPAAQPEPARVEARATDASRARFTLQLSSFRERAEADAFFQKLRQAGYAPYVVEAEVPDKGTWYRVRLGHYDSYEAALGAKRDFEASQHIIAYVTRLKS